MAALALLDLLDMAPAPARERVVEVRVEAPEHVDDVVVSHADAGRRFENVKLSLAPGTPAWRRLWEQLRAQRADAHFRENDEIAVIVADRTPVFDQLVGLAARSVSEDAAELAARLNAEQLTLLGGVVGLVGSEEAAMSLLQRTTFRHLPAEQIESEFRRRRLAGGSVLPATLLGVLRDVANDGAQYRALFRAGPLRQRLLLEHGLRIAEPPEWGLAAYRGTITRLGRISIPGTRRSGPVEDLFVWPTARDLEPGSSRDFEEDYPSGYVEPTREGADLRDFPQSDFDRVVVVAGPGYGKSALLTALAHGLSRSAFVPVEIPLASLTASGASVIAFLGDRINAEFDLAADWRRLAEQGLLVLLFDGLDEIPAVDRPRVLDLVSRFSSRYSQCPWLITARDPAVLTGLPDARVLELAPLSDRDIGRFVSVIATTLNGVQANRFVRQLGLYPDLNRLARIPLFLSMLLATTDAKNLRPLSRSDLIEAYLKTLFSPAEHKDLPDGGHPGLLRKVAEAIAFRKIEDQEIGTTENEVRTTAADHAPNPDVAELVFRQLLSNGILRRQGPFRMRFPYPIVQEYLAACHLVTHEAATVGDRLDNAVSRPWAQVMQFAIEQHPDSEMLVRQMLSRPDDAFRTGLRLVGRCVANGAHVSPETRRELGSRLVEFWKAAPSRAREATGRLIHDGFSAEISAELEAALHQRWLIESGAGDIISRTSDHGLTLRVLGGLVARDDGDFKIYRSLRPAISSVRVDAIGLVRDLLRDGVNADTVAARSSILLNFEPHPDIAPTALELARDASLPTVVRLRAYAVVPAPLEEPGVALLTEALRSPDSSVTYAAISLLPLVEDPARYLTDALLDDKVDIERKVGLVYNLPSVFRDARGRLDFVSRTAEAMRDAEPEVRCALDLVAAAGGERQAFERLVTGINRNPIGQVAMTVSLFGLFRDATLATDTARHARGRFTAPDDVVRVSRAATTGMVYVPEVTSGFVSLLHPAPAHPGVHAWAALLEHWSGLPSLTELQRLDLLTAASRLGSETARIDLQRAVETVEDPNESRWADGNVLGATVGHAIGELRRRSPLLDKAMLERFVRADQVNMATAGVTAIAAHGDLDALRRLVVAHGDPAAGHARDALANAIEVLSARVGVAVAADSGRYVL